MYRILVFVGALVLFAGTTTIAAPLNYHEGWDAYAAGTDDPTYQTVWDSTGLGTRYNIVTTNPYVAPNCLEYPLAGETRGVMNNLADGIVSGQADAAEMAVGEWVIGTDADPLNAGFYLRIQTLNQRKFVNSYIEMSMGDVHAPTDLTTVLPAPIPVVAYGLINGFPGNSDNVGIWFFNGQQWIRSAAGAATGYNKIWMHIRSNTMLLEEAGQGGGGTYARVYLGGFDRVTLRSLNTGTNPTGANRIDDVYVTGGVIAPEPATLVLLSLAAPLLRRRRA